MHLVPRPSRFGPIACLDYCCYLQANLICFTHPWFQNHPHFIFDRPSNFDLTRFDFDWWICLPEFAARTAWRRSEILASTAQLTAARRIAAYPLTAWLSSYLTNLLQYTFDYGWGPKDSSSEDQLCQFWGPLRRGLYWSTDVCCLPFDLRLFRKLSPPRTSRPGRNWLRCSFGHDGSTASSFILQLAHFRTSRPSF